MPQDALAGLYDQIARRAREAGVFDGPNVADQMLRLRAKDCGSEAHYFVDADSEPDVAWVGLSTLDRWLSESIEADLMHRGDDLEELLEDELHDQGWETTLKVQHFRDEQKQYVFRSAVRLKPGENWQSPKAIDRISRALLAYEACFRELGDVCEADDLA